MTVTRPGDDDNVYFLGDASVPDRVQLDTWPDGQPPFVVEADARVETSDVAEAVAIAVAWLGPGDVEQPLAPG
ncbi:hypothetical protein [Streptomyces sp. NPDC020917]|uniref:hypothetical protein n=1 Tax=Streptomyces sp. NPDC020917 TaxID=3365102 RepID=UPI0037BA4405